MGASVQLRPPLPLTASRAIPVFTQRAGHHKGAVRGSEGLGSQGCRMGFFTPQGAKEPPPLLPVVSEEFFCAGHAGAIKAGAKGLPR